MASSDLIKLSKNKSTESGRRFQRLINLSLKNEERVELLKRLYSSQLNKFVTVNAYQAKYNFVTKNQIIL